MLENERSQLLVRNKGIDKTLFIMGNKYSYGRFDFNSLAFHPMVCESINKSIKCKWNRIKYFVDISNNIRSISDCSGNNNELS
jgi:hypothetical protein